jgi:hypothetical protein
MAKVWAQGSEFRVRTATSPETFESIGQLMSISGLQTGVELRDVQDLSQIWDDMIGGRRTAEEITLSILFDKDLHDPVSGGVNFFNLLDDGTEIECQIVLPEAFSASDYGFQFPALVSQNNIGELSIESDVMLEVVIKPVPGRSNGITRGLL